MTETLQGGKGLGGGFSVEVGDVSATDSMVIDSDAFGPESTGGAVRFVFDSTGSFTRCTFANNLAEQFGGASFAQGSHLDLDQCIFLENQFSPGTSTLNVDGEIAQAGVISAPPSIVTLNATPNAISSVAPLPSSGASSPDLISMSTLTAE